MWEGASARSVPQPSRRAISQTGPILEADLAAPGLGYSPLLLLRRNRTWNVNVRPSRAGAVLTARRRG